MGLERPRTASKFVIIVQKKLFLEKKLLYLSKPVLQMKKNFYTCPKKLFLKMIIPFIHPEENLTFSN